MRPLDSAMLILTINEKGPDGADKTLNFTAISPGALDPGAERGELFFERLVAAVEVIDAIDHGLAIGHQASDDQARRGAQIGRHDGGALQPLDAFDHRRVALDRDLGAQPLQFQRVHEAVLEDSLGDSRGDRKSTRLNSSHLVISYAVFCLKKKKQNKAQQPPDIYYR